MSYDPNHLTRQKDNKALAEKVKFELDNIKEDVSDLKSAMEKIGLTVVDGQFFIQPVESI